VDGYAAAFASLAAQAPSGTVSEANLKDSAWRSVYSSTVQTLESLGTRARALTPPPCLIEAHTDLVRATQAVDGATPHIALSTNAPSAVTAATQTMLGERAAIERAAARLKTAAC
jgi:hypothetical protein